MKNFFLAIPVALLFGCTTEINVNGNNNMVNYDPARNAGQNSNVDVLKGMSLPSLNLGGSNEKQEETQPNKKNDESYAENVVGFDESISKNTKANVSTPVVEVTESDVKIKTKEEQ